MTPQALKYLVIHCTATPEGLNVTAESIENYHLNVKGWSRTGYSRLYLLDGTCHVFRTEDGDQLVEQNEYTFGTLGHNYEAFHWCYVGGLTKDGKKAKDTMTEAQFNAIEKDLKAFLQLHPQVFVCGHNQFDVKSCPSFDTRIKLKEMFIPDANILKFNTLVKL